MITLGIDIGSATSKCVLLRDGRDILASAIVNGGIGTEGSAEARAAVMARSGLAPEEIACTVATGYGRGLYRQADAQVSELSCHAIGAHAVFPDVRTVIDIGGQDVKVIALDERGRMKDFIMNDKCAAGTGRFLEVMANVLRLEVSQLEACAARAERPAPISNTCTVFAESEVISQLANGVPRDDLVAGICDSVARKVYGLARRLGVVPKLCMSGGVARNAGVRLALEAQLGEPILFSDKAQLFGALGAAISAYNRQGK